MTTPPAFGRHALVDVAAQAPVTMVIGESDVGKTTLVTELANGLLARGFAVAIVDADLGQSEIGPPTTVGLGRVVRPLTRPADAEVVGLRFVGATSAARDPVPTVVATRRLLDRARTLGFERVLVDTSGLVRGDLGRRLKQAKIDALAPELVVALERDGECEAILHGYRHARSPRVLRVPAVVTPRLRTPEQRRRHRARALAAHFAGARTLTLDLSRVVLRSPVLFAGTPLSAGALREAEAIAGAELVWAEERAGEVAVVARTALSESVACALARHLRAPLADYVLGDLEGLLAGLDDVELETLGLGVVERIDCAARTMTIETAVSAQPIAAVTIGRERYRSAAG